MQLKYFKTIICITFILTISPGPTRILPSLAELLVNVSDPARIECGVTTDPAEEAHLKVEWLRNGDPIDYNLHTHLYMNRSDYSLRIRKSKISDTAENKCHADNGLDHATSDGTTLTVRGYLSSDIEQTRFI